ncbi:MAG: hypothetical protein ACTTH6_01500 [Candidatus Altimarinota bacterium]
MEKSAQLEKFWQWRATKVIWFAFMAALWILGTHKIVHHFYGYHSTPMYYEFSQQNGFHDVYLQEIPYFHEYAPESKYQKLSLEYNWKDIFKSLFAIFILTGGLALWTIIMRKMLEYIIFGTENFEENQEEDMEEDSENDASEPKLLPEKTEDSQK